MTDAAGRGARRPRPQRRRQVHAGAAARRPAARRRPGRVARHRALAGDDADRRRTGGGRPRWPGGSARCSRTRSTSSSAAPVVDELALGPRRIGPRPSRVASTVDDLLDRLRLAHLAAREPVHPLRRRGAAAERGDRAGHRAAPAVLDEPTFGQDRRTWRELVDLLADLRDDGHGVVAVTHDADFVAALADRTAACSSVGSGMSFAEPVARSGRPAGPAQPGGQARRRARASRSRCSPPSTR